MKNIRIMGIVNVTDDSFYEGSRLVSKDGSVDFGLVIGRVGRMIKDGADIIDFGACSTRPGSDGVGPDEEWRRLEPVLDIVRKNFPDAMLSVDTYQAEVVRKCHALIGDFIVNDISAGQMDPEMLRTVGTLGLPYIAMHIHGTPKTMQSNTDYPQGVVEDLLEYFDDFALKAAAAGIRDWILDPGFGFAKTVDQNYELLNGLSRLKRLGKPILVGLSRKSMIYKPLDITPEDALPATQVVQYEALRQGADILRVHDVAQARQTAKLYARISPL